MSFLLGNGFAFILKRYSSFSNKAIPAALFVWNMFGVMIKAYDPDLIGPEAQDAAIMLTSTFKTVGFFSIVQGLFAEAAMETAKQMAAHAVGKNTFAQFLLPVVNSKFGLVKKR
jgi:hypothetical protein